MKDGPGGRLLVDAATPGSRPCLLAAALLLAGCAAPPRVAVPEKPEYELARTLECAGGFALSPDGTLLAHYRPDRHLEVVSVADGKPLWSLETGVRMKPGSPRLSPAPAFAPDPSGLYALVQTTRMQFLESATGKVRLEITLESGREGLWSLSRAHPAAIFPIPRGDVLLTTDSPAAHVYYSANGNVYTLAYARSVIAGPAADLIVGATADGPSGGPSLSFFDAKTYKNRNCVPLEFATPLLAAPADMSRVYVAEEKGSQVQVWTAAPFGLLSRHTVAGLGAGGIRCVAVTGDGRWLAVGAVGTIHILRGTNLEGASVITGETSPDALAFDREGRILGVHSGKTLRLYRRR